MIEFTRSDWGIAGSSGGSATVGTPTLKIQIGGSYLRLPVKKNGATDNVMLQGPGLGVSGGIALETPWTDWINVSGSADFYPSKGVGPIYRKVAAPDKKYEENNFKGDFLVLAGTAAANLYGMSGCLGIWLNNHMEQCLTNLQRCEIRATVTSTSLKILPGGFPLAILHDAHAVGVFWGLINTTDVLSAGISAFQYRLV